MGGNRPRWGCPIFPMNPIVPAVMPKSLEDLHDHVADVCSVVDWVQIDIMDGEFVSGKTWPYPLVDTVVADMLPDGLPYWEQVDYELDLMVVAPEETWQHWLDLGPSALVVHYESVADWEHLLDLVAETRPYVQCGLSFDDDTPIEDVLAHREAFDYIQCMGIDEIGAQGQPFSARAISNIQSIKQQCPEMLVAVDGSVNFETIQDLAEAGAERFVVGSAVFAHDNPAYQVGALRDLLQS